MDLAELIGRMSADEDKGEGLTDVQIIGRLKSIHDLRGEKHNFKPGQIVRHKFPDLMKNSRISNTPGVFIRWLDKPITIAEHPEAFEDVKDWATHVAADVFDCVVGFVLNGNFVEFFENTADWRPATEADYGPIINIDE